MTNPYNHTGNSDKVEIVAFNEDGTAEAVITPGMPKVVHEGRYRLYENPDGGMRIQYRRDDKDEDDFVQIPAAMIALSKAAAEGNLSPVDMVRRVMKIMSEMRQ